MVSEATRSSLSTCKSKTFPGVACPQTLLVGMPSLNTLTVLWPDHMQNASSGPDISMHFFRIIHTAQCTVDIYNKLTVAS